MDEIEFRNAYMHVISLCDKLTDPDMQRIIRLMATMVASVNDRVTEMQEAEDDDE